MFYANVITSNPEDFTDDRFNVGVRLWSSFDDPFVHLRAGGGIV